MTTLEEAVDAIERLGPEVEKLRQSESELKQSWAVVKTFFAPPFRLAAERYNEQPYGSHLLVIEGATFGVKREDRLVNVALRLEYPSGSEPDEDFGSLDEPKRIGERFKPFFDEELEKIGTDYRFGSFQFPTGYYMK